MCKAPSGMLGHEFVAEAVSWLLGLSEASLVGHQPGGRGTCEKAFVGQKQRGKGRLVAFALSSGVMRALC